MVSGERWFLKLKDTVFMNPAEHLYRAVAFIKAHDLEGFGTAIIDVGAANGGTCGYFAKRFPSKMVHGFEPQRDLFTAAKEACRGLSNVTLYNLAASDANGTATIYRTADPLSSSLLAADTDAIARLDPLHALKVRSASTEAAATRRLDDVLGGAGPFLLMKLDTQGTELAVLKGSTQVLSQTKLVLVEMNVHALYKDACLYNDVDGFLRGHGFVLRDIIVTYRPKGVAGEYDALYENMNVSKNPPGA